MRRVISSLPAPALALLAGFAIGLSLGLPVGARAQSDAVVYDGNWWLAQSHDEKYGFYSGFSDCYVTDVGHGVYHDSGRKTEEGIADFDRFYRSGKYPKTREVLDVIRIEDGVGPIGRAPPDHDYYDGMWWAEGTAEERDGYVRAYLACQAKYLHRRASKPTAFHVRKISEWYQMDAGGAASMARVNTKIGDEIVRLLKRSE